MGSLKSPCLLIETDDFTCEAPALDFLLLLLLFSLSCQWIQLNAHFVPLRRSPFPLPFHQLRNQGSWHAPHLCIITTQSHTCSHLSIKMCFWMDDQRTADLSNRAFSKQLFTSVTLSHHHRGARSAARCAQLKSTFLYYVNINNLSGVSSMRMSLWGWWMENAVSALFKSQTIYTIISGFVVSLKHSSFEKQQSLIYISDQTWISITCSNTNII